MPTAARAAMLAIAAVSPAALSFEALSRTGRVAAVLVAAACGALWLAFSGWRPGSRLERLTAYAAIASAAAVVASSALAHLPLASLGYGQRDLLGGATVLGMLLVFVCATTVPMDRVSRTAVAVGLAWAAPAALLALWQRASGLPVSGALINSNDFGTLMVVVAPVALGLALAESSRPGRIALFGLAAVAEASAVVSGSTGALVAAGGALLFAAVLTPALLGVRAARAVRAVRIAAAVVLALALLVSVLALGLPAGARGPLGTLRGELTGPTVQNRVVLWRIALEQFASRPLTGIGPDGYSRASQPFIPAVLWQREPIPGGYSTLPGDPHNLYLNVLASLGLLGTAALLVLFVVWAVRLKDWLATDPPSKSTDAGPPESAYRVARAGFLVGSVGFLISQLVLPFTVVYAALPALIAGLAVAPAAGTESHASEAARAAQSASQATRLRAIAGVLAAAVFLVLAAAILYADVVVRAAVRSTDSEVIVSGIARARRIAPGYGTWASLELEARALALDGSPATRDVYERAVDSADDVVRGNGLYLALAVRPLLDEAAMTARTGPDALIWERRTLERAGELLSFAPDVVAEYAHLLVLEGRAAEAAALLEANAERLSRLPRATLYAYYAYSALGDPRAAELRALVEQQYPDLVPLLDAPGVRAPAAQSGDSPS